MAKKSDNTLLDNHSLRISELSDENTCWVNSAINSTERTHKELESDGFYNEDNIWRADSVVETINTQSQLSGYMNIELQDEIDSLPICNNVEPLQSLADHKHQKQENKSSEDSILQSSKDNWSSKDNIDNVTEHNGIAKVEPSLYDGFRLGEDRFPKPSTGSTLKKQKKRKEQVHWSNKENRKLMDAVNMVTGKYGTVDGHWNEIAKYVGSRDLRQCCNRYKNCIKKVRRWNNEDTKQLNEFINKGYGLDDICRLMEPLTRVQIQQQIKILTSNNSLWTAEDEQKLIQLKEEGILTDTEIGRQLGNRHTSDVRKKYNQLKKRNNNSKKYIRGCSH